MPSHKTNTLNNSHCGPLAHQLMAIFCLISLMTSAFSAAQPHSFVPAAPSIAAESYLLMDAKTGTVIAAKNEHTALPPASLTKLMTSYIAAHELEQGRIQIDDQVLISEKAWRKGGSKMYIRVNTRVGVEDLLRGMIIQSGNDASIAIAEHIAGSEDAFADLMNHHATLLNMTHSRFQNATGWPAENHHTSASDMALLARALITKYPNHYGYYREKSFTYNEIKQSNRNLLLWRDETVDGVKTGHTEEAGYCLVSSAERNGMRLISVVMGTQSKEARASQSLKLLNYGFRFYHTYDAYEANQLIHEAPIWMGQTESLALGITSRLTVSIAKGHEDQLKAEIALPSQIKAPIAMGESLGQLLLKLDDQVIAEAPLVALASVESAGAMKRAWHWLKIKLSDQDSQAANPVVGVANQGQTL